MARRIVFTKTAEVNTVSYKKGSVLNVSESLYASLVKGKNPVAKDFVAKTKTKK